MVEGRAVASALVFRAFLPPHPALSLEERENRPPHVRQSRAPGLLAARDALFPLPEGEGEGEGERDAANQNGWIYFASSIRPAPAMRPAPFPPFDRLGLVATARSLASIRTIFETAPEKFLRISLPKNRRHGSMMA